MALCHRDRAERWPSCADGRVTRRPTRRPGRAAARRGQRPRRRRRARGPPRAGHRHLPADLGRRRVRRIGGGAARGSCARRSRSAPSTSTSNGARDSTICFASTRAGRADRLSSHDFDGVPADLDGACAAMRRPARRWSSRGDGHAPERRVPLDRTIGAQAAQCGRDRHGRRTACHARARRRASDRAGPMPGAASRRAS